MRQLGHVVAVGVQETAASGFKFRSDVGGGNETVMANLDESRGQDVHEKPADEFHGIDSGCPAVFCVASGLRGYHFHRNHRVPGAHPVARGRIFAVPVGA